MGGMVVLGGYWIVVISDKILVDKNMFIGLIGIFGVMFNLEKIVKNLGIWEDGIVILLLVEISSLKLLFEE